MGAHIEIRRNHCGLISPQIYILQSFYIDLIIVIVSITHQIVEQVIHTVEHTVAGIIIAGYDIDIVILGCDEVGREGAIHRSQILTGKGSFKLAGSAQGNVLTACRNRSIGYNRQLTTG